MSNMYIRIELDNDAFDDQCGSEIARILGEIARKVEGTSRADLEGLSITPRDINGNAVGTVDFEIDENDQDESERDRDAAAVVKRLKRYEILKVLQVCTGIGFATDDDVPRQELASALIEHMVDHGMSEDDVMAIVRGY